MTPLIGVSEAARLLGVSKGTVRNIVATGKLPVIRLTKDGPLRFDPADLEKFVAAHKS